MTLTVNHSEEEDVHTALQNNPATGMPTIGGTAQVGETLTADVLSIADTDGRNNATFSYQWLADGTDISGATDSRYTLTDSEEGKAIKVQVSFIDDAGNDESLTSDATEAVAARPAEEGLGLGDFDAGDGQDILASALIQAGDRGRKNCRCQLIR